MGLAEASFGKVDLEQITLGQDIIWEKSDPYVPGTMVLVIETTKENQVVNLGYNLGRWQGDKSAAKYPTKGTIKFDDELNEVEFNGTEGTKEEDNSLVHTYAETGEHRITINGIIKWNKASTMSSTHNSIQEILKSIEIPENEISPIYYIDTYAFYYYENLESIPGNLFENCTEVTNFEYCFHRTPITKIPEGLFDKCTQAKDFSSCFYNTKITEIPTGLFDQCPQATNFNYCFSAISITAIPEGLFDSCTQATNFYACFYLTQITAIPQDLFANNNAVTNFSSTFYNCSEVEGELPTLWESHPNATKHTKCFTNCTQATNYQEARSRGWA